MPVISYSSKTLVAFQNTESEPLLEIITGVPAAIAHGGKPPKNDGY